MSGSKQIADQFREVYLSGKWLVFTNLKEQLSDLDYNEANTQVGSLNTIALLAYHLDYYVGGVMQYLEGKGLTIRDKYSFDMPSINSEKAWDEMKERLWKNAERFASLIEGLTDEKLEDYFFDKKYGTIRRNLHAIIEHCFYHLGQVVLIKKMIREKKT